MEENDSPVLQKGLLRIGRDAACGRTGMPYRWIRMEKRADTQKKWIYYLLILALAAYTIKNLFVGADVDEGYGIMAGYRLARGDRLVSEMWEPHQTSAIFTALFVRLFLWFTGGSAGFLNLYLRAVYFMVHAGIAFYAARTLRACVPDLGRPEAGLAAAIFYVTSPKCIYIPEYSNLHVWFFAMLCFCFMRYFCPGSPFRGKTGYLFAAGLFLACDVLAYPSMAILFPVCILFILLKHVRQTWKECLAFALPCVLCAAVFVGYLLSYMTGPQILRTLPYILGEGSHQTELSEKLLGWAGNFRQMAVSLAAGGICALLAALAVSFGSKKKKERIAQDFLVFFFLILLLYQIFCWFTSDHNAGYPQLLYVAVPLAGIYAYYRTGKTEKTGIFLIAISFVSYFAIMILSNWGPIHLNPYLYMGVMGGLLCLRGFLKEFAPERGIGLWRAGCLLLILGNVFGYCYLIIGGEQIHSSIFTVRGICREGLRKGLFTSYMTAYEYNANQEVWPEAVPDGSTVLYIGPSQFLYMLGDCTVASPNTISTFGYDESVLEYWKMNPERYPDVVVVESWFGESRVFGEDSFIMQWLEKEYQAAEVVDYSYITVYRK